MAAPAHKEMSFGWGFAGSCNVWSAVQCGSRWQGDVQRQQALNSKICGDSLGSSVASEPSLASSCDRAVNARCVRSCQIDKSDRSGVVCKMESVRMVQTGEGEGA